MKVIITGVSGMVGSFFARIYQEANSGCDVYGLDITSPVAGLLPEDKFFKCNILERDAVMRIFESVRPDIVIHMAAQAYNGISWDCEYLTHATNIQGSLNVLYCAKAIGNTKVLLGCSSAEYGNITPDDCPLIEERPLKPFTPYGVSKAAMEMLGYQYYLNYDFPVFLPRMFIHVGPGHPPTTAIQNFARQLAKIKTGQAEPIIRVGNLTTRRDFIDVRDGAAAMKLLIEKGEPGVPVNICNGIPYLMSDILDMLIVISGTIVKVESDPALVRKADEPLLLGNCDKIKALGYTPKYTIRQTLEDVFEDWMHRV